MIFDLDQTNLFFKIMNTWCTRRFLYPYLGQSFRVDLSMIGGGSYLWTLYCYYFIPKFGSLFRAIVSGWRTRQWHWDSSLLDFGIFEIGLRIRMGCGCEGQICLIGNLFSTCANHYVPQVYNLKNGPNWTLRQHFQCLHYIYSHYPQILFLCPTLGLTKC